MSRAVPCGTSFPCQPRRPEGLSPPSSKKLRRGPLLDITNQICFSNPSASKPLHPDEAASPQPSVRPNPSEASGAPTFEAPAPPQPRCHVVDPQAPADLGVQEMTVRFVCTADEEVEYSRFRPALQAIILCTLFAEGCVDAEWNPRWRHGSFLETVRSQQLMQQRPLARARLAIRAAASFWEVMCHRGDVDDEGSRSNASSTAPTQHIEQSKQDHTAEPEETSFTADVAVESFEAGGRLVWGAQIRAAEAASRGWFIALHCYKGGILETGHVWVSLVYDGVIVAPVGLNPLRERDPDSFVEKLQEFRKTMLGTQGVVQHEAATFDYVVERGLQLRTRVWPLNTHAVAVFSRLVQESRRGGCRFLLTHRLKVAIGEEYEEASASDASSESPSPSEQPEDCLDFLSLAETPPCSPNPSIAADAPHLTSNPLASPPRGPYNVAASSTAPRRVSVAAPPEVRSPRPSVARRLARRRLSECSRRPSVGAERHFSAVEPVGQPPAQEHLCPCTAPFHRPAMAIGAVSCSGPTPSSTLPTEYRLPAYLNEADHPRLPASAAAQPWGGCLWARAGEDTLSIVWAVPYTHVVTQQLAPQPHAVRWHGALWRLWFQADVCCVRLQVEASGLPTEVHALVTLAALGQDSSQTCSVAFPELFCPSSSPSPGAVSRVANVPLWQLLRYGGTHPADVPLGPRRYVLLSAVVRVGRRGPPPIAATTLQMSVSNPSTCLADQPPAEMTEIGVLPYHLPGLLGDQCTTWALKLLARVLESSGHEVEIPALVHPNAVWEWIAHGTS